ncbi:Vacuolar protein 8 [Vitis vinifera]|uniref:Vacuolar protein 8 n=1 Tax=Vitis vinifera TaxID=29760 RepID=A0A438JHV2_VITVI|nr:Vacuolar protein 8 [Vitis vinifera]
MDRENRASFIALIPLSSKLREETQRKARRAKLAGVVRRKTQSREAIELICSLISLSHSIKVFAVKWQTIRNKLDELNSGLTAAENCDSGENPVLSTVIWAIIDTVNECYDHARRCVDLSYSGKLLMQSDLDVLLAKFDAHIRNLSAIYQAGILTQQFAIVVSRPGLGACRDDMRFYVRDLQTRMKIGDTEMKRQALVAFNEVVNEDDKYVKIVVEIGDIISLLATFLDSLEMEIQEESAKAISVIAGFDMYKSALIGAGVIAPLIRVLECGSELGRRERRGELVGLACGVLKNLAGVEEIKRFMVEEGAITAFLKLARSKDESVQINSIEFLQSIVYGDESIRQMVIREGGIRVLVRILDPNSSFSSKTRERALRAIETLCFSSLGTINILLSHGFMDQLLFFLRNGEVLVQELALKVSFRLCGSSEEAKKSMGDAGFIPELIRLLHAKSFEIREMAAEALSSMVLVSRNRRKLVQEDGNIGMLLQLLESEEGNSGNRKFLLSILMSLTSCNSGRKKIVNSGYMKNIEKLAEADVSDAKRIVKKLSTNRLRTMLSGIWNS